MVMTLNIPNVLTMMRIVAIPLFVFAFLWEHPSSNLAAFLVFSLAAVTDWLDGYLARKWGQTSAFGAFLDPVADKLIVATALVLLVHRDGGETLWLALSAAIIVGREITISALREWMAEMGQSGRVKVSIIGKIKTIAQMVALLLMIYHQDLWFLPLGAIGLWLLYAAAVLTLWSMVQYLKIALPQLLQ